MLVRLAQRYRTVQIPERIIFGECGRMSLAIPAHTLQRIEREVAVHASFKNKFVYHRSLEFGNFPIESSDESSGLLIRAEASLSEIGLDGVIMASTQNRFQVAGELRNRVRTAAPTFGTCVPIV